MKSNVLARSALVIPLFLGLGCQGESRPHHPSLKNMELEKQLQSTKNNSNPPIVGETASGTLGSIERLDPAIDGLLAKDAKVEILAKGLDWAEGPVWSTHEQCLYFSDVPQNVIYRWDGIGGLRPYLKPSGYWGTTPRGGEPGSNGLTFDKEGRLVACQHGERRVARLEKDGKWTVLADRFEGKRFNSPNDLVFDSKGNLFFTDPAYGMEGKLEDPKKELPFQGVYQVSRGEVQLVTKDIKFPNGVALSPDEKLLYVAASDPDEPYIWAFHLGTAHKDPKGPQLVNSKQVFFNAAPLVAKGLKGLPDGLKVDQQGGNLWLGGPGGIVIISPAGKHLGTIRTGEATANCAWGDDGSTLYFTADMYLCRIKTLAKGKIPG